MVMKVLVIVNLSNLGHFFNYLNFSGLGSSMYPDICVEAES